MLTRITSADNARIKLVRKLATRKGRNDTGLFIAEGLNSVYSLICSDRRTDFIMMSESFYEESDERAEAVRDYACRQDTKAYVVESAIFGRLTDAEHGVDVLAAAEIKKPSIELIYELPKDSCILICDRIQDPGNMGTMIRTACAAGYSALVLMPETVDVYSPKVLRSTAGMIFDIPVAYSNGADELEKVIHRSGRRMVATSPSDGIEYYKANLKEGIALVIGNEACGVSEDIMKKADVKATIPMKGNTESLNAAVAAALLMYEAVRSN